MIILIIGILNVCVCVWQRSIEKQLIVRSVQGELNVFSISSKKIRSILFQVYSLCSLIYSYSFFPLHLYRFSPRVNQKGKQFTTSRVTVGYEIDPWHCIKNIIAPIGNFRKQLWTIFFSFKRRCVWDKGKIMWKRSTQLVSFLATSYHMARMLRWYDGAVVKKNYENRRVEHSRTIICSIFRYKRSKHGVSRTVSPGKFCNRDLNRGPD